MYNENEDFYAAIAGGSTPEFDVLVCLKEGWRACACALVHVYQRERAGVLACNAVHGIAYANSMDNRKPCPPSKYLSNRGAKLDAMCNPNKRHS